MRRRVEPAPSIDDGAAPLALPSLRDPRLLAFVPMPDRAATLALWSLVERLGEIAVSAREPLLAQIKLAWWRDRLIELASGGAAMPVGEPLLAELGQHCAGQAGLVEAVDAAERIAVSDGEVARCAAVADFGATAFALAGAGGGGQAWALHFAAHHSSDPTLRTALLSAAAAQPLARGKRRATARALAVVDGWSRGIARRKGDRRPAREAWDVLRFSLWS